MGNANEAALPGSTPGTRHGFRDSLGDRLITAGAGHGELLEVLHLRAELTAVSSFEFALRERAARLANFQHTAYARTRQIDRLPPPDGRLAIVSEHVAGWRLAEILSAVQDQHLELDINAALCLIKQLVHGVAILHQHARGVAHGALGPERVVVTAHARLVIVEYVLGSALERLEMSRDRLWRELRIAVPPAAGSARFDARTDVTQLGTIAMALVLGCPLAGDDYPDHMAELLAMATENRTLGGRRPLSKPLRTWLARALQIDLRHSFQSAIEAESELEALLIAEPSYVAAPVALETFLAGYQRSVAASPRFSEPPADEADDDEGQAVEIALPSGEPEDAAIELDGVIEDLDHLLDEPAAVTHPGPVAYVAPAVPASVAPAVPSVAPAVPTYVAPAVPSTPSTARVSVAPIDAAPGPAERASVMPATAIPAPAVRAEAPPPRAVVEPPVRPTPPPVKPVPTDAGRDAKNTDHERGYPGSFESLFGNHAGAATADNEERGISVKAKSRMVPMAIGLAALLVLLVGGYVGFRYLVPSVAPSSTGTLVVESQPPGLSVKIDGRVRGTTPVKLSLAPGHYQLELETGGQPRVVPITITAGGQVSQYIDAPAVPATGRLQVTSEPAGATVLVDGERKGSAPLLVNDLAVGRHRVELQADGATVQQEVTIDPGGTSSLVVPISSAKGGPVSGWLSVSSPVEVQVFEGTQLIGTSQSDRILITAGRHDLDIVNDTLGYKSRQTVQVTAGKTMAVKVQLPKGVLSVNAQPWAEVWVDGERVGETPIGNLALTIGPHEVVFRHPQLGEQKHAVTVTTNAPARLSVDLRK
jgi:hypothetical protein